MSLSENLYLILVAVAIIIPAWMIISAYNKRVNQIEELRARARKGKVALTSTIDVSWLE